MRKQMTYAALDALGRERLSRSFYMRDFLYSEIAHQHQLHNFPHFPDVALKTGRHLCTELLEPLQQTFGRIHVRSGYRSPEVNELGNRNKLNCASNEQNYAEHIWDYPDANGHGATACVVIPVLADYIAQGGSWQEMAWWIHDHLLYSTLCFFSKSGAFNIGWHERPSRRIDSYAAPQGCLVRPGMSGLEGSHADKYTGLLAWVRANDDQLPVVMGMPDFQSANSWPVCTAKVNARNGLPLSDAAAADGMVNYRAVHTRTAWRRANNHKSEESAISGPNGAAALFAGKVRTDYVRHGDPLFVLVWLTGALSGKVIKPASGSADGISIAPIPAVDIERFERCGAASPTELASYFKS
jgi:hypothetical protein